jgi:cell division control protein 6
MAFELGAVEEDVVDLIAELAFSETGNARFGIELLWRAGKYADAEQAGMVGAECVRLAVSNIVPGLRRSELAGLGLHEKMFLLAIARYFKENEEAYALLSEVEKTYSVICEEMGEQPKGHTQIYNYAQFLSSMKILKLDVASVATRGRSTRVSLLSIPANELEKELNASIEQEKVSR